MKRVLLQAPGFLGDEVVFTGAVRELALQTGWSFRVNTQRPDLWLHPGSKAGVGAVGGEDLVLTNHHCPPFRRMDEAPLHFLEQYVRNLRSALGLEGDHRISRFGGEVGLTQEEIAQGPLLGLRPPYWVIAAGCKTGVPTKGWGTQNYQEVVDHLRGRILFVQAGANRAWHPPLTGVVDAVDKTSLRELIRLIYYADGVVCPITSLMHLAAAIPMPPDAPFPRRPCVVLAGGREAPHYINYPMHRVLHTVGLLPCCASGGCGHSRFGSGSCEFPERLPGSGKAPRCMTLIKPADVVAAIEFFHRGSAKMPRHLGRVGALFRKLQRAIPDATSIRGAEVGVLNGEMSAQLLRGHLGLHLIMADRWQTDPVDPTDPRFYSRPQAFFDGAKANALNATDFAKERRTVIARPSVEAAQEVPDASLDFVFIDADHSYEGCQNDIHAWVPKLKPGGLLCGHDYHRPQWPKEGVKRAVEEFATTRRLAIETDKDNTWFITLLATPT